MKASASSSTILALPLSRLSGGEAVLRWDHRCASGVGEKEKVSFSFLSRIGFRSCRLTSRSQPYTMAVHMSTSRTGQEQRLWIRSSPKRVRFTLRQMTEPNPFGHLPRDPGANIGSLVAFAVSLGHNINHDTPRTTHAMSRRQSRVSTDTRQNDTLHEFENCKYLFSLVRSA